MRKDRDVTLTFRFTFPKRYSKGSPGHDNATARQGYYGFGSTWLIAKNELWDRLVNDHAIEVGETFRDLELDERYRSK